MNVLCTSDHVGVFDKFDREHSRGFTRILLFPPHFLHTPTHSTMWWTPTAAAVVALLAGTLHSTYSVTIYPHFFSPQETHALYMAAKDVIVDSEHTHATRISKQVTVDAHLHQRIRAALGVDVVIQNADMHSECRDETQIDVDAGAGVVDIDVDTGIGTDATTGTGADAGVCSAVVDARSHVTSIIRSTMPHQDHYRQSGNVSTLHATCYLCFYFTTEVLY
jgi:hypothetical protein